MVSSSTKRVASASAVAKTTIAIDSPVKVLSKTSTSLVLDQFVYTERNSPDFLTLLEIANDAFATDTSVSPHIELVKPPHTQTIKLPVSTSIRSVPPST